MDVHRVILPSREVGRHQGPADIMIDRQNRCGFEYSLLGRLEQARALEGGRSHRIMSHPWGIFSALMVTRLGYYIVITIAYGYAKISPFPARVT